MLNKRLIALAAFFMCSPALSADLTVLTREPIQLAHVLRGACNARLEGRIEKFDSIKVNNFERDDVAIISSAQVAGIDEFNFPVFAICLDKSDGGDFEGGLEVAKVLRRRGIAAVVPKDGKCLSACAIAFLGGTIRKPTADDEYAPLRVMDVSALVGFHAPLVPGSMKPGDVVPYDLALEFFVGGVSAVRELARALPDRGLVEAGPSFPSALMLEMLTQVSSSEFVMVDTVDKAGAFNIRLSGVGEIPINPRSMMRLCDNVIAWDSDVHSFFAPDHAPGRSFFGSKFADGRWRPSPDDDGSIDASPEEAKLALANLPTGIRVGGEPAVCDIKGGASVGDDFVVDATIRGVKTRRTVEPWASLPFYVPLAALRGQRVFDPEPYRPIRLPRGVRTDADTDIGEPVSNYIQHVKTLDGVLRGRTMILAEYFDGEPDYIALNFKTDGSVERIWRGTATLYDKFSITGNEICFISLKEGAATRCAAIERNAYGWALRYTKPEERIEMLLHIRMGAVAGALDEES